MGCTNGVENGGVPPGQAGPGNASVEGPKEEGDMSVQKPSDKKDQQLLSKYVLGKIIGQGAFGIVYACTKKGTKQEYAVKMIDQVETPLIEIKQEVNMLQRLAHPCVVKMVDVYFEKVFVCMVMEIYKGSDLIEGMQAHWKTKGMIPIPVIQNVTKMMVQGVDYLHSKNVVHRDLKGDNYLMDVKNIENPQCRVFLSDFGTVVELRSAERLKQKCGTKTYWSPEFYKLNYSFGVDIWAIGVIVFGMVTGRFPFKGEEDAKNKTPRCPSRTTKDGESFILGTLIKDEVKRLSARQSIEHRFLASIKSAAEVAAEVGSQEEAPDPEFTGKIREAGANAAVKGRRVELVERLEKQQKAKDNSAGGATAKPWLQRSYEVEDRSGEGKDKFEWWAADKVKAAKFVDESKAKKIAFGDDQYDQEISEFNIRAMLEEHAIESKHFGTGQAKSFSEFTAEIQSGASRLMLDAAKHKNMVRVVDLILVRIAHGSGSSKKYLVKHAEKFPDGRARENIWQLPGHKMMPFENAIQCCERAIKERLHLENMGIVFDFEYKEVFEDDEDSPSYPGVRTVYRKQIYEGKVTSTNTDILNKLGLTSKEGDYSSTGENGYVREFKWLTESECIAKKLRLRAPKEGSEVSTLVNPPAGFKEEDLQAFLLQGGVDVEQFGKNGNASIQDLSDELTTGESGLVKRSDGRVVRVVDLVILSIVRKTGEILVEVTPTKKERMPAVKRRADENPFWAAHRLREMTLKISENSIRMDPHNVMLVEEERASKGYAGVPTIYRRRIIPATIVE